ncbi:MAG TPA: alpha/beta fold hydrolase [Candidatus Dormibacteraeota bacterium]
MYPEPYARLARDCGIEARRHHHGPGPDRWADLRLPPGPGPHPVAMLLHGGFWRMPWGADLMHALAGDLHRRGWATWNLEYRRLGAAGGGWPGTLEDVAAGADALAGMGPDLDLRRLVAVGHSAGGHLALWLAARPGLPAGAPGAGPLVVPAAVVALAAVSDLAGAAHLGLGGGAAVELLGGAPEQVPERYRVASPRQRLPLGVPQLLVHGELDDRVPVAMSRGHAEAARAAGDAVELVVAPGAGHADMIDPQSRAWQAAAAWVGTARHDAGL